MLRFAQLSFYTFIVLILTGCGPNGGEGPETEGIKIADLAPIRPLLSAGAGQRVTLDIYTLEVARDEIERLSIIFSRLYTKPIRPESPGTLEANSFKAVFGEAAMWEPTAAILQSAGAMKTTHSQFLMQAGQTEDLFVGRISHKKSFFYFTPGREAKLVTFEPSRLVLSMKLLQKAGVRGAFELEAKPVIIPADPHKPVPESMLRQQNEAFSSVSFTAEINNGTFLLLGPTDYPQSKRWLNNLFFASPAGKNRIRLYVIFCTTSED